jgi:hypothetical protein
MESENNEEFRCQNPNAPGRFPSSSKNKFRELSKSHSDLISQCNRLRQHPHATTFEPSILKHGGIDPTFWIFPNWTAPTMIVHGWSFFSSACTK